MSYKTKLRIGEFSQLMQVTVKTLRHYEQKGLLLPDEVDEWTGYRYYGIGQMQTLQARHCFFIGTFICTPARNGLSSESQQTCLIGRVATDEGDDKRPNQIWFFPRLLVPLYGEIQKYDENTCI